MRKIYISQYPGLEIKLHRKRLIAELIDILDEMGCVNSGRIAYKVLKGGGEIPDQIELRKAAQDGEIWAGHKYGYIPFICNSPISRRDKKRNGNRSKSKKSRRYY
jgi:hypothetical protein